MKEFYPNPNLQGQYTEVNGLKMYYEIHGKGNPLVLIHGGGSDRNTTFGRIIPALAKNRQVIAVDLQAHGLTADREQPLTFRQDADDIAGLLDQLNIAKADILGFSNGGQTCIEIGLRHPEKISKLVIASAFYKRSGVPTEFWNMFDDPQFSQMPQVYKEAFLEAKNDPTALLNMFQRDASRMSNFKDWTDEDLQSVQAPVLVVIGDQDLPTPAHAITMAQLFPKGRLSILPGNHGSYMGEIMSYDPKSLMPEAFVAMLEEFLSKE